MLFLNLTLALLYIFSQNLAFPQWPHNAEKDQVEQDPHIQATNDDWYENTRYTRQVQSSHPPHYSHYGDVHPENIRAQLMGSDQIEYEHVENREEVHREIRQVHLIPPDMVKTMDESEKLNEEKAEEILDALKPIEEESEIKKVVKRDQIVVESSLYEKHHNFPGRQKILEE